MGGLQLRRLVGITRNHMRMKRRLEVAEDGVVDPLSSRDLEHRVSQTREILKEERPFVRAQSIEARYDGVRKQQSVTPQDLPLTEHRPAREETRDDARLT